MVRFDDILFEAMKLSPPERDRLAQRLLESLPAEAEDDLSRSPEFVAELERRSREAEAHPERLVTLEQFEREFLGDEERS